MSDNKRVFLLDFDGVLCNSLDECLIVSYNTYYKMDNNTIDTIPMNHRDYFYENRWLVRPAGEYCVLWKAFESGLNINEIVFGKLKMEYSEDIDKFQKLFYNNRAQLKSNMPHWLSLHETYDNIKNFIYNSKEEIFIVTNKDKQSVELLSKYFGYFDKIINIYSMEISFNKTTLIKKILQDYRYNTKETLFIFVDDNIENLKEVDTMQNDIQILLAFL